MGQVAALPGRGGRSKASQGTSDGAILKATRQGRLEVLEALRDKVAKALDRGVPARELASLSRRLIELEREIEAARAGAEGERVGEAIETPNEPLY